MKGNCPILITHPTMLELVLGRIDSVLLQTRRDVHATSSKRSLEAGGRRSRTWHAAHEGLFRETYSQCKIADHRQSIACSWREMKSARGGGTAREAAATVVSEATSVLNSDSRCKDNGSARNSQIWADSGGIEFASLNTFCARVSSVSASRHQFNNLFKDLLRCTVTGLGVVCQSFASFQFPLSPNSQLTDSNAGGTLRNGKIYTDFVEDAYLTHSSSAHFSDQSTLLRPWKKENVQSEPKASPWSWNHTPKANEKVHKKADATKVAATSRIRTKAEQMENEEPEFKAAAVKNWRRPSPKVKKMMEPKEEGELVKLFRQQKETGGRRVPLGAVDTNVAGSSASTDNGPPRAGKGPGRCWCWGLALGEKKLQKEIVNNGYDKNNRNVVEINSAITLWCEAAGRADLGVCAISSCDKEELGITVGENYVVRFKSNYVIQPNSVTGQKWAETGGVRQMAAYGGRLRDSGYPLGFNVQPQFNHTGPPAR
ncbi:hypothetical protein DFH08DRAFT_1012369 [Mycena albidolilacea]|uniref:Uncharacterized protein n=1 Tax=Mycena albidolilacea TaxID=1033008 RepID=A0AAD7EPZ4_9AGAR|nr:hypothetical protein DFH08DRAFT_1012369 [Mycena albidolilacea]